MPHDITDLNDDLARRLGTSGPVMPQPTTAVPPVSSAPRAERDARGRGWLLVGAACFLLLGLGAGWLLFGRSADRPVTTADEESITSSKSSDADANANTDPGTADQGDGTDSQSPQAPETLTLEDLFEDLLEDQPFEGFDPEGSPFGDSPFGELPLDDFMNPEDFEELQDLLENMPSSGQFGDLFGELDGPGLEQFLDPEGLEDMTALLDELNQLLENSLGN